MRGNMLDAVQDHTVLIAEDDIAVFSHQFYDQKFLTGVSHFIAMLQSKFHNSFHAGLVDTADAGTADVLTQEHAEVWCGKWAWFILIRKIDQREGSVGGEQKSALAVCSLSCDH